MALIKTNSEVVDVAKALQVKCPKCHNYVSRADLVDHLQKCNEKEVAYADSDSPS